MPVVGLTGGIASGKSTAARVFESEGAVVIDADDVARRVTAPGEPAFFRILERFGSDLVLADGSLDRARLAEIVFRDSQARKALEGITHPEIFQALRREIREHAAGDFIVVEAALLVETLDEWKETLQPDVLVVVFSPPVEQERRLRLVRNLTEPAAVARLKAQGPWEAKLAAADYVIDNSGSKRDLEQAAARVWEEIRAQLAR